MSENDLLTSAILKWQLGDWDNLSRISREDLQIAPQNQQLSLMIATAWFQLGDESKARQALEWAKEFGVSQEEIALYIFSSLSNTLGRAQTINGDKDKAYRHFQNAISCVMPEIDQLLATQSRIYEQSSQLGIFKRWIPISSLNPDGKKRNLFIDCGGHDGCSVVKFLLENPAYDVVSFEGNPELWPNYEILPTTLIKKLVFDRDGFVEFTIDPVDADGSSIIKEKNIDYYKKVKNEDCPKVMSECVDLSAYIKEQSYHYQEIILKLDVEGAEYAILNKILKDGTIHCLKKIYAEFHWNKINMPKEEHDQLVAKLNEFIEIEEWDAQEFSVHKKGSGHKKIRKQLLNVIV